jgi:hypothetical protein
VLRGEPKLAGPESRTARTRQSLEIDQLPPPHQVTASTAGVGGLPKTKKDEWTPPFIPAVKKNLSVAFSPGFFDDKPARHEAAFLNP